MARGNLGLTLHGLHRFDEARQEIRRAIECDAQFGHASHPWKTWNILASIETDARDPTAAAQARGKAVAAYLAYRHNGGENHDDPGRLALAVSQALLTIDPATAVSLLQEQSKRYRAAGYGGFIDALQAIVTGSRDRSLADAPGLDFSMTAEILFLIERLEDPRRAP